MKVTIVKEDKFVRVNDNYIYSDSFDFSSLPIDWRALQWEGPDNGKNGVGEIEYSKTSTEPRRNVEIKDITDYMKYVNQANDIMIQRQTLIAAVEPNSIVDTNDVIPTPNTNG